MLVEVGNTVVKRNSNCNHFLSRKRLRIAQLPKQSNEVGGGAQRSLPRRSSLASWSRYSSPNQSGGATFEPPSHHPKDDDNTSDEQRPMALSHPTKMEVDNLAAAPQHLSGEVVPDKPPLWEHEKLVLN